MNTKTQKVAKKEPIYTLSGFINGSPFTEYTSDVKKAIKSLEPEEILTETYITLSRGEGEDEISNTQRLNYIQSKRVFRDDMSLEIFVNNLLVPFN